jgi:hypothetical protein
MKYMNNHYGVSNVFGRARCKIPMNLQHFAADGAGGGAGGGGTSGDGEGTGEGTAAAGSEGAAAGGEGGAAAPQSFDDFLKDPKNQAEIEAKMQEARTEAEKMAKMNAEQKAQYEREKQAKELADREAAITKRELMATAKEQLAEKGLPISLASVLNYSSAEECTASMDAVGKAFQEAVEKAVNDRLAGGKPPKKADNPAATYTMEQIKAMTPEQINANWDAVQASMKAAK